MTSLRTITPPTVEPVSLETVKAYLRIDSTYEDALLTVLVAGARAKGEDLARRAFLHQTLEMTLDAWPADNIVTVWRPPLSSVTSVKYKDPDGTEATWTDYLVDTNSEPGRIILNSLPSVSLQETGGITVRFVAGYGAVSSLVPSTIQNAVLSLVAYWYEMRMIGDVPEGIKQAFMGERVVWF